MGPGGSSGRARASSRMWLLIVLGVLVLSAVALSFREEDSEESLARQIASGTQAEQINAIARLADKGTASAGKRLIECLRRDNTALATQAINGLGHIQAESREIDDALVNAFTHKDWQVRQAAVIANRLRNSFEHPRNMKQIMDLLRNDPVPAVRCAAANSLGELQIYDGVDPLLAAMESPSLRVRMAALESAEKIMCFRTRLDQRKPPADWQKTIARFRRSYENEDTRKIHAGWRKWRANEMKKRQRSRK